MTREELSQQKYLFYGSLEAHDIPTESLALEVFERVCTALTTTRDDRDELKAERDEIMKIKNNLCQQNTELLEDIEALRIEKNQEIVALTAKVQELEESDLPFYKRMKRWS